MSTSHETEHWYYSEEDLESLEYLDLPVPGRGRLHELILEDPVSQLNAPKPIVVRQGDPVAKAVKLMRKFRFGSVLVVDGNELVGILTEKDLLTMQSGADLKTLAVSEIMTPNPQGLEESDTIANALNLMSVGGYRHIPVMRDGKPIGFVSIRGILRYIRENALDLA